MMPELAEGVEGEIDDVEATEPGHGEPSFRDRLEKIFFAARSEGEALTRLGIELLSGARAKAKALHLEQTANDLKDLERLQKMLDAQDASAATLMGIYPTLVDDIMPRRLKCTTDIEMSGCALEVAERDFSKKARECVEKLRNDINEKTDASPMIEIFKDFLRV